jgi:hypothetical protein
MALVLTGSIICSYPGDNGTITSTTSVSGVNYQLYDASNAPIQAAQAGTGSGLSWSNLAAGNGYYVIGTNAVPCSSTSNIVNVATINSPIALVLTGSSICASLGDDGTITSTTSESGVDYQLYNESNAPVQAAQAGTGSGLTWSDLTPGTGYYVIGTNTTTSCVSPGSNAVNVSATDNPIALVLTGSTICTSPGDNGTITSTTSESGVNYQLYDSDDATVQTPKAGTGSGLTWSDLTPGTDYYVIGTNAITSCVSPVSNPVDVSATDNPIALVLTGSTICISPGDNGMITSTTSESDVNYQLFNSSDVAVQEAQTGTGSGLTWSGLAAGNGYYVIGTNAAICTSTSDIVDVSTTANPSAPDSGGNQAICANETIPALTVTVGVGETADWYDAPSGGTLLQSDQLTYTPTEAGTFYAEARNTTTGCVSTTRTGVTLEINPQGALTGSTICSGGTGQLIFTALSGTSPFTLIINEQPYSDIVSGTPFNAIPNPTITTNYTLTSVTDASDCMRTTGFAGASATITVIGSGSWLGGTSANWNDGSNWCGGVVPAAGTNITITSLAVNQPVISNSPTAVCKNLTIDSGASLTINAGQALTVNGTLTNNGTLNLNSDAGGIASLISGAYTRGTGATENIELYLTGGGDATNYPWHYISSPVAALSTTDVMTSGADPDANDLAAYYENLVTTSKDLAWWGYDGWNYQSDDGLPASNAFSVLEVGRGYNYYSYYDATRTFGGSLNSGVVSKYLSYSGSTDGLEIYGWNLIGNPFTSSIDWDRVSKPGSPYLDGAIYFTHNNTFASYVYPVGTPEGTTGIIPPMQGFFVKANVSGISVDITAFTKVHGNHNRYKGDGETIPLIRLKIENQKVSDEAVIYFNEKAQKAFDSEFDAYKFSTTGGALSVWTIIGPVDYSINGIPFPDTVTEIPVGMNAIESGTFKLTATQLQGLENYDVFLVDKTSGTTTNLKTNPSINFTASEGIVTDRFVIKIINISTGVENPVTPESVFNIYSSKDFVNIQTLSDKWDGKSGSVDLIDMTGKTIRKIGNAEFSKISLIQIPANGFKGIYFVKMQSGLMRHVGKVMIK